MAEDIVFSTKIDPDGSGAKSLKSLKAEFKQLQAELEKTEVGTAAYQRTLEKLGNVRDDLGDLNATINALNPEGKVQAFANVAGKLAGGFQAATGAAALFGVQSEELEKQLLRVQAATALAQGIQSVVGLTDAFKVLGTVIAANPIMAIAGIIAAAATAIVALSRDTENLTQSIDDQKTAVDSLRQSYDDYLSLIEAGGASYEEAAIARVQAYEAEIKQLDILKAEYDKLFAASEAGSKEQIDAEIEWTKISKEQAKLRHLIELEFVKADKFIRDQAIKDREKAEADAIKRRDERVKEEIRVHKQNTLERLEAEKIIEQELQAEFDEVAKQIEAQQQEDDLTAYLDFEWRKMMESLEVEKAGARMKKQIEDKNKADRLKAEQEAALLRLQQESLYLSAVSDLSVTYFNTRLAAAKGNAKEEEKIRKKQFEADKALRAAQTIINTAEQVAKTASVPPLAIAVGLAGAAALAKILSTQYTSGASPSSSSEINVPTANIQTAPPRLNQPSTRLNEGNQNLSVRAYVLETDITNSQDRVSRLKEQATIG